MVNLAENPQLKSTPQQLGYALDGDYQKSPTSLAFPILPVAEIPQLIEQSKVVGQRATI